MASGEFEYDVAVSFAGENRPTAEKFAEILKAHGMHAGAPRLLFEHFAL